MKIDKNVRMREKQDLSFKNSNGNMRFSATLAAPVVANSEKKNIRISYANWGQNIFFAKVCQNIVFAKMWQTKKPL